MELILKYLGVWASAMLKFIFGPVGGYGLKLSYLETVALTIGGMMTTVVLCTFLGKQIKKWLSAWAGKGKPKRLFTPKNRKKVKIWLKYGIIGVAFLTPLLLTPIGGTLTAVSFGEKPPKILFYMLLSAVFFAFLFTGLVYVFGDTLLHLLGH